MLFVGEVVVEGDKAAEGIDAGGTESRSDDVELLWSEISSLLSDTLPEGGGLLQCTFICFRNELGCVYDLSHPRTLQLYGLSDVWT